MHLRRQFQRRRQNHCADVLPWTSVSTIHLRFVRVQSLKDREKVRRRLTRTGRGDAQQIAVLDDDRNRLHLDRGRLLIFYDKSVE